MAYFCNRDHKVQTGTQHFKQRVFIGGLHERLLVYVNKKLVRFFHWHFLILSELKNSYIKSLNQG